MKIAILINIEKESDEMDNEDVAYELSQFLMNEGTITYHDNRLGHDVDFKVTKVGELELDKVAEHFEIGEKLFRDKEGVPNKEWSRKRPQTPSQETRDRTWKGDRMRDLRDFGLNIMLLLVIIFGTLGAIAERAILIDQQDTLTQARNRCESYLEDTCTAIDADKENFRTKCEDIKGANDRGAGR